MPKKIKKLVFKPNMKSTLRKIGFFVRTNSPHAHYVLLKKILVHPKTYGCSRALNVQNKSALCTYVLRKVLWNYNFNQKSMTLNRLLILKQMGLLVTSEKKTALHTNLHGCLRTCYFYIIPMRA